MTTRAPTEKQVEAVAHFLREEDGEDTVADWNVNAGGCRDYYMDRARGVLLAAGMEATE